MEVKKEKMKMKKGEGEERLKKKAVIGILLAVIMMSSAFSMMTHLTTGSDVTQPTIRKGYIVNPDNVTISMDGNTTSVLIGQNVQFMCSGNRTGAVTITGIAGTPTEGYLFFSSTGWFDTGVMTEEGMYNATYGERWELLGVQTPVMALSLKVGTKEVSSICCGTPLRVDFTSNLDENDCVDLKIVNPDGRIKVSNNQKFDDINVSQLLEYGSMNESKQINTTGWKIGDYTFQIKTKSEYACGLSASSAVKDLTIVKGEIDISAEKTTVTELETIKLTVTGVCGDIIWVNATPSSPHVLFVGGVEDTPAAADGQDNFDHKIDADGKRTYAVKFNDTGSYTIKVTVKGGPRDGDYDTVDIAVTEKGVTFDIPTTVVIGERLTIKGTANTGDWVQIAVDDIICTELKKLVIAGNGEFEKEIDTGTACSGAFSVPGSVRLKAFIDTTWPAGTDVSGYTDDGSMAIFVSETHLDAILSKATLPPGDSFEVYGTASSDYVEIVAISPKGGNGTGIDGLYGVSIYTVPAFIAPDAFSDSEIAKKINVSECAAPTPTIGRGGGGGVPRDSDGDNFYKKIKVDRGADTGNYTILLLSPGMDGIYGDSYYSYINSILDLDGAGPELGAIDVSNRTKEEIVAIIEDIIHVAGSDGFMWIGNIVVTQFDAFDTGESENPYPSIFGMHNGTIIPSQDINVTKLYTYPCPGTGGHTEHIKIWNNSDWNVTATWNGYTGDWHNISFNESFTLHAGVEYNYTIRTGSYPQIIHNHTHTTLDGSYINCTEFTDANGKRYNNWIPAIKLLRQ